MEVHHGSCNCAAIRYSVTGPLRPVLACHCTQCRKQSGHFYAATNAPDAAISVEGSEHLKWYKSSAQARRGFCSECGSALFWKHEKDDFTSILAGSFDGPTGLKIEKHIFCAFKGDYYEIPDEIPKLATY
jgi:hypothetical protein